MKRTERALRLTYVSILPAMAQKFWRPRLGYSRPALARECERSHTFFELMGQELGDWWFRLAEDSARAASAESVRLERAHLEDACSELATLVSNMLPPSREVVLRRASGMSWRKITADLPHRAYFSMTDDWSRSVAWLWDHHGDVIRRIV